MRIFLTGATGLVGSALVPELIQAGHQVLGLTRSEAGAGLLTAAGAEALRGDLADLDSLRRGVAASEGVIHCAFDHDFSRFVESAEIEKKAIGALGDALRGTARPLIVSTGLALPSPTRPVTEEVDEPAISPFPRIPERLALALASQGINASVVRLPQVHNTVKHGLVTELIASRAQVARATAVSACVGEGLNRWPAAHVRDVAHLYRLALEKSTPGARYHAVAEEGVRLRDIADAIGQALNVPVACLAPEQADAHFGFVGRFAGRDLSASSELTRRRLGWQPVGPGLIEDLRNLRPL